MTFGGEIVNVWNGIGTDLIDEEFHVGTCNEGLTGTVEHDGVDGIVAVSSGDGLC